MELVLGLLCLVATITVVGHAIWLAVAAVVRALAGSGSAVPERHNCPACGGVATLRSGRCTRCGATPLVWSGSEQAGDAAAALRQLDRLRQQGNLTPELHAQLVELIQAGGKSPVATASGAPEVSAPADSSHSMASGGGASATAEVYEAEVIDGQPTVQPDAPTATRPEALHPLDRPEPAAPQRPARRPLVVLLQAFMEERNIRWGEIISGMLIVVSAVGLVVSLWATLRDTIPYLPALIFMLGTGAFHAAGHYSLRRWDLQSVSRAVLVIGTLLIPLNFLAAIALGSGDQPRPAGDALYLLAVGIGLAAYGTMAFFAGRALLAGGTWRLLVAVLGTSAGQLLVERAGAPALSARSVSLLMALPLGSFLVAVVGSLRATHRWKRLSPSRAYPLLLISGVATFCVLCPAGLMVAKGGAIDYTLAQLAPTLSLVASGILAAGLLVQGRTKARRHAALRATGTALAIGGSLCVLAAVWIAWPVPALLLALGLANAALLTAMAWFYGMPALHAAGVAAGGLAVAVGYHLAAGNDTAGIWVPAERLGVSMVSGQTALGLSVYSLLVLGIAGGLQHAGRAVDRAVFAWSAVGVAAVSVLLAVAAGFLHGQGAALTPLVLGGYALGGLIAGRRLEDRRAVWAAGWLFWLALVQLLCLNDAVRPWLAARGALPSRPLLAATLVHSLACGLLAVLAGRRDAWTVPAQRTGARWRAVVDPLTAASLVSAIAALPFALIVRDSAFSQHAVYCFSIAASLLSVALVRASPRAFGLLQLLSTVAVSYSATGIMEAESGETAYFSIRHGQVQVLVLGIWNLAWSVVLGATRATDRAGRLLPRSWPSIDQLLPPLLVALLLVIAVSGCVPGMLRELGLNDLAGRAAALDYEGAYGGASWIAMAVVGACLFGLHRAKVTLPGLLALIALTATIPLLLAAPHERQLATASALRWLLAGHGLVLTGLLANRARWAPAVRRVFRRGRPAPGSLFTVTLVGLVVALGPVVVLTTWTVARVARGAALGGPAPESVFAQMGPSASYAIPLLACVACLFTAAAREQQPWLCFTGSLLFQYLASLACLLPMLTAGRAIDTPVLAELLQWNACALGLYALAWLAGRRWIEPPGAQGQLGYRDGGSALQVVLAAAAVVALAGWSTWETIRFPATLRPVVTQLGALPSYLAWVLAAAATSWRFRVAVPAGWVARGTYAAAVFVPLLSASVASLNSGTQWVSFHVLMVGWTAVATALVLACCWPAAQRRAAAGFFAAVLAVLLLSIEAASSDPAGIWWALGCVAALAVSAAVLGALTRQHAPAYASTVLAAVAAGYFWLGVTTAPAAQDYLRLAQWIQIAVTISSLGWLGLEVQSQRRHQRSHFGSPALPSHRFFALPCLAVFSASVFLGYWGSAIQRSFAAARGGIDITGASGIALSLLLAALFAGLLWDRRARHALFGLYACGLASTLVLLDILQPDFEEALVAWSLSSAAYVALTGVLWRRGANWSLWGQRHGISDPVQGLRRLTIWLPALSLILTSLVALLGLIVALVFLDRHLRFLGGASPALAAVGIASLGRESRRKGYRFLSLLLVALAGVYVGWADIDPEGGAVWLHRLVRALMVMCATTFGYSLLLARRLRPSSSWYRPLRQASATVAGGAACALAAILLLEAGFYLQDPVRGAPLDDIQLVAVAIVMVGLVAALIILALLPDATGAELGESARMGFVYAAQLTAALLFAHLFLSRPRWFAFGLIDYWPYIVVGIAFAGAAVGELFRRLNIRVLGEPFQQTGAFLPLVPAVGMWGIASESDYSVLFFLAGLLYVFLSLSRGSARSAFAAAIAGNAALWSLLSEQDFQIWRTPQFWMIPPAASVLIAAELNRARLPPGLLTAMRYGSLIVIYVSSTGEMFLRGIGQQLWPPVVLLGLSLCGALLGVALRVRAFLYLGSTFSFLAIVSMVWHASRAIDHTWPWWAFGIGFGLAILTLFGVFEKHREQVARLVEDLREWQR